MRRLQDIIQVVGSTDHIILRCSQCSQCTLICLHAFLPCMPILGLVGLIPILEALTRLGQTFVESPPSLASLSWQALYGGGGHEQIFRHPRHNDLLPGPSVHTCAMCASKHPVHPTAAHRYVMSGAALCFLRLCCHLLLHIGLCKRLNIAPAASHQLYSIHATARYTIPRLLPQPSMVRTSCNATVISQISLEELGHQFKQSRKHFSPAFHQLFTTPPALDGNGSLTMTLNMPMCWSVAITSR